MCCVMIHMQCVTVDMCCVTIHMWCVTVDMCCAMGVLCWFSIKWTGWYKDYIFLNCPVLYRSGRCVMERHVQTHIAHIADA